MTETTAVDLCNPSPCGSNSHCRPSNGQAVCSCVTGFKGSPPFCRAECIVSTDCPRNRACSNQKCIDPCLGACGLSAQCSVINHNPVCSCFEQYTGDPFIQCVPQSKAHLSLQRFLVKNISLLRFFHGNLEFCKFEIWKIFINLIILLPDPIYLTTTRLHDLLDIFVPKDGPAKIGIFF